MLTYILTAVSVILLIVVVVLAIKLNQKVQGEKKVGNAKEQARANIDEARDRIGTQRRIHS